MPAAPFTNCNFSTTCPWNVLISINIIPWTIGIKRWCRVMSIDVKLMSPFTHFEMLYTSFLALFMSSWTTTIFLKRGCALYTKLRSIHHFKGLNKGCVLYTGASYTREITVCMHAYMYVWCMHVCMYVRMFVCMCVCEVIRNTGPFILHGYHSS